MSKIYITCFVSVAFLACGLTPSSSFKKNNFGERSTFSTSVATSVHSVPGIILGALEEYASTPAGKKVVYFQARQADATELSLVLTGSFIHCQRYTKNSKEEYSCQMHANINSESGNSNSVQAHLLRALLEFSKIPTKAGYHSIIFGSNDYMATEVSVSFAGEKIACNRYLETGGNTYGCQFARKKTR